MNYDWKKRLEGVLSVGAAAAALLAGTPAAGDDLLSRANIAAALHCAEGAAATDDVQGQVVLLPGGGQDDTATELGHKSHSSHSSHRSHRSGR